MYCYFMTLVISLGSLATFLEFNTQRFDPSASTLSNSLEAVRRTGRSIQKVVTASNQSPEKELANISLPINLSLPNRSFSTTDSPFIQPTTPILDGDSSELSRLLNNANQGSKVTYEAELVFDRNRGEDITGGKINIKIPFS